MIDEFGNRRMIIPAEVKGRYRQWKTKIHFVLLLIFLLLPWVQIDGTQAVLLDIPNRHFELFGYVFLSHDSPLLFFLLISFAMAIMLVTALWGRVWCGWACPQTVFIDSVYRKIEYWIEGSYIKRRRLHDGPLTSEKFIKQTLKWMAFAAVSSVFAHSFAAYFTGSRKLIEMMQTNPGENWTYFAMISFFTGLLLFNFGWFREQFCIIMCPYGRFQGVLMDNQTYNVTYDVSRGEPRKGISESGGKKGDCVSCNRCVQVCPTGIDIRNGLQMECIGCTACMDACDEIMMKVKKPEGLISYRPALESKKVNWFRPRVAAYFIILIFSLGGFAYGVNSHRSFSAIFLKTAEEPFQITPDGRVLNHLKVNLHNQAKKDLRLRISVNEKEKFLLTQAGEAHTVEAGKTSLVHLFVGFEKNRLTSNGTVKVQFIIEELNSHEIQKYETQLIGPLSTP
jgi:cytochrome c oxidase accessory protein FixG